jgi:hypothetical protein
MRRGVVVAEYRVDIWIGIFFNSVTIALTFATNAISVIFEFSCVMLRLIAAVKTDSRRALVGVVPRVKALVATNVIVRDPLLICTRNPMVRRRSADLPYAEA